MPSRKLYHPRRAAGLCVICAQPSPTAYCAGCYWASRKTENLGSYLPDFERGIHCRINPVKPPRKVVEVWEPGQGRRVMEVVWP
jgi:hypothetical protein